MSFHQIIVIGGGLSGASAANIKSKRNYLQYKK